MFGKAWPTPPAPGPYRFYHCMQVRWTMRRVEAALGEILCLARHVLV
jgi:hypothetical protein